MRYEICLVGFFPPCLEGDEDVGCMQVLFTTVHTWWGRRVNEGREREHETLHFSRCQLKMGNHQR